MRRLFARLRRNWRKFLLRLGRLFSRRLLVGSQATATGGESAKSPAVEMQALVRSLFKSMGACDLQLGQHVLVGVQHPPRILRLVEMELCLGCRPISMIQPTGTTRLGLLLCDPSEPIDARRALNIKVLRHEQQGLQAYVYLDGERVGKYEAS